MAGTEVRCWKCGCIQKEILVPLPRDEECQYCGADLHVCRMCRFYDTTVSNACREPIAESVSDKTRSNFCGYLELQTNPVQSGGADSSISAREGLDALFGLDDTQNDEPRSLDDLFGGKE